MENFTARQMLEDPTPGGIISHRVVFQLYALSESTSLSRNEKERLFRILLLTGKKLVAVWQHKDRFEREQASTIAIAKDPPAGDFHRIEYTSQALFLEFDGFLVQLKSALDYLVHMPPVALGACWTLRTFGKSGKAVLQALDRNVPAEHKMGAAHIARQIREHHLPWLDAVVRARDRMNHLLDGDVSFEVFSIVHDRNSGVTHVPKWSADATAIEFMEITWANLLRLVEDFVGLILGLRKSPGLVFFHGPVEQPHRSPWLVLRENQVEEFMKQNRLYYSDERQA
jgi:hypothetical protein